MRQKQRKIAGSSVKEQSPGTADLFDDENGAKPMTVLERLNSRAARKGAGNVNMVVEDDDEAEDILFERLDSEEFVPDDNEVGIKTASLESKVGFSSLSRQLQSSFVRQVAFYRSKAGGGLSIEEARAKAFHICTEPDEAKEVFRALKRTPVEDLKFIDFLKLHILAPRVAERLWEQVKQEGRKEFESGHLGANISFPAGYMKEAWNIARYQGVRESFIEQWKPKGGIEISLIDMLTESYFQWQYWLEQSVKRSRTPERQMHPQYAEWMSQREEMYRNQGWTDGYWFRPTVSEQQAIEFAFQMADRWNRIFLRTMRHLRDLRRYAPVTINNPSQVNIAADGGKQINVAE